MPETLRAALVGCGGLGSRHAANIDTLTDVQMVALCDAHIRSAQDLSDKLSGTPEVFDDHTRMLDAVRPDAVLVVTPNHTHDRVSIDATRAGAHVFCEKPMALSVEACDAMIAAARTSGVGLQIGYVRRFQNAYREMRRWIAEGRIGEVSMVHALRLGTGPPGGTEGWQLSREAYGGLFSMHSHELDQMTWMAGEVSAVSAIMRYGDDARNTVEESIFLNLEFESGVIGSLSSSRIYPPGSYELGVAGSEGALQITSGSGAELVLQRRGEEPERHAFERNNALLEEITAFLGCVRDGKTPQPDGWDGRRTIALSLAAHESARSGNRIRL